MVPPEQHVPVDEREPLTALAVCSMLELEDGESSGSPSSWGEDRASEEASDPLLVGIVASSPNLSHTVHPFFGPLIAGLRARLLEAGCDLLVSSRSPFTEPGDDPFALERLRRRGVDGLVAIGLCSDVVDLGPLLASDLPVVFIDQEVFGERVGFVGSDNVEGMTSAVQHLRRLGCDRIATITGPPRSQLASDRLFGYRSALSFLGLELRDGYVVEGDYFHQSGYEACARLLALREPPNAIVATTDAMAVGAILAIEEAKLRVPEDVAVIGFDDNSFAARMKPALTTVRRDAVRIGQAAADAIVEMLRSPDEPPPAIILPTELVVRESCGAALATQKRTRARSARRPTG